MSEFINKHFKRFGFGLILSLVFSCSTANKEKAAAFDLEKDLLLAHYDCKTDVDDVHSMAALFIKNKLCKLLKNYQVLQLDRQTF